MKRQKSQGSITVFLSMILLVIVSITVEVLGEAVYQADRIKLASSMDLSMQSVLSQYDAELLEQYGLFFVWATEEKLASQLDYYLYRNVENTGGMVQMNLNETNILAVEEATDNKAMAYYREAVEAESGRLAGDTLKKAQEVLKNYEKGEENRKTLEENQVKKEQLDVPKDLEVDETAREQAEQMVNPVEVINAIKDNGVCGLLTYDMYISPAVIDLSQTTQRRGLNQGTYQGKNADNSSQELLFDLYLKDHFSVFKASALVDSKEKGLQYQQEYIISGKESDRKNLNAVIEKLLWIREGVNFVYLLSDASKVAQADALATALVGYTGIVPLVVAMKFAILGVWAYGESLLDVRILLQGGKLEFLKSEGTFRMSLENLPKVAEIIKGNLSGDERGMSYQDYMFLFLSSTSRENRCYRSMDIIEQQMQLSAGKSQFHMDNCVAFLKARASVESRKGRVITIERAMGY